MSLLTAAPTAAPTEPTNTPGPRRTLAFVLLALFSLVFIGAGLHRIQLPFGDSHDGRNGAVWAVGARSILEEGPITSALGGRRDVAPPDQTPVIREYFDHPPAIYSETALAQTVGGDNTLVTRLPAWAGSLIAIWLLFFLLEALGLSPLAAAAGTIVGLGCPMFGAYGLMLDTWIVGLPWGIAAMLLWRRRVNGQWSPTWLIAGVATIGALTSWLNVIVLGFIGLVEMVEARGRREKVRIPWLWAIPAVSGVVLTFVWAYWVSGSIHGLTSILTTRTGGGVTNDTPGNVVSALWFYWKRSFTAWQLVLGLPALLMGLRNEKTRAATIVAGATVLAWIGVFRDGVLYHDYWSYWMVLPLAIGFGAAVDAATTWLRAHRPTVHGATVAVVACVLGVVGLLMPNAGRHSIYVGAEAGTLLTHAQFPADQTNIWYIGTVVQEAAWLPYDTHRPDVALTSVAQVDQLAATAPNDLVFVDAPRLSTAFLPASSAAPCRAGVPNNQLYSLVTAVALDRSLHAGACPAAG